MTKVIKKRSSKSPNNFKKFVRPKRVSRLLRYKRMTNYQLNAMHTSLCNTVDMLKTIKVEIPDVITYNIEVIELEKKFRRERIVKDNEKPKLSFPTLEEEDSIM